VSLVAGGTHLESPAALAERAARRPAWLHPVAVGAVLGAALAITLSGWFISQARVERAEDSWNRGVIIQLMALGDAAAALETADGAVSERALQSLLEELAGSEGHFRIVRLSGSRLLASTAPADTGEAAAPRRLARDEKWLFDLAQGVRAAVETNVSEGVFRRRQVHIEALGQDRVRVSLPYFVDGRVTGIVQAERERVLHVEGPSVLRAIAGVGLAWLAVGALVTLRRRQGRAPDPAARNWGLFGAGALLLAGIAAGHGALELAGLRAWQVELSGGLAERFTELQDEAAYLGGALGISVDPGRENRWDVDLYQRPMGMIDGQGRLLEEALQGDIEARAAGLRRAVAGNLGLGLVVFAFFALGAATRTGRALREHRYAYTYVLPAMFGMLILVFFPFAYGIALSFTEQTALNVSEPITELFVGVSNYIQILGDFHVYRSTAEGAVINYQNFYWTLFITVCWTVTNVTVGVTFGMLLALTLNTRGLRFTNLYRVLLILPWAIPNYITALIWRGMFHQQFGVINQAIQMFGGEPVAWFDGVFSGFMTGLITNGWLSFPFMMVVILGGLQSISQDMYEAATIDGASKWQQFWQITLPSLKPTIIPAVILSVVWTFNMFNIIYLVSGGEPAGANEILITKAYKIAFEEYRYGYSAAYSVVIFMILLAYGVLQTRVTRATEATSK
jgi:arabinogalactan oligomer / maltooligosaccharide transport system permease protein